MVMVDEAPPFPSARTSFDTDLRSAFVISRTGDRIQSLILFTGTPHRGKDFGFLALMRLIRPDLFDPRQPVGDQLPKLREAMIRNNKALVTDLEGPAALSTREHRNRRTMTTRQPRLRFYQTMSAFILDGRAYALSLTGPRAVGPDAVAHRTAEAGGKLDHSDSQRTRTPSRDAGQGGAAGDGRFA